MQGTDFFLRQSEVLFSLSVDSLSCPPSGTARLFSVEIKVYVSPGLRPRVLIGRQGAVSGGPQWGSERRATMGQAEGHNGAVRGGPQWGS